ADQPVDRLQAQPVQRLGRLLQRVDFSGREGVAGPFPPIRLPVRAGVEIEAERLDLFRPVGTRRDRLAAHRSGRGVRRPAETAEAAAHAADGRGMDAGTAGAGIAGRRLAAVGGVFRPAPIAVTDIRDATGITRRLALLGRVVALAGGAVGIHVAPHLGARKRVYGDDRGAGHPDQRQKDDVRPALLRHRRHPAMHAASRIPSDSDSPARSAASETLPSETACGRCGISTRATRKPPSWTIIATIPQTIRSTSMALCAMTLASGITKPRSPPLSATAAAMLPSRISASSRCGVSRV